MSYISPYISPSDSERLDQIDESYRQSTVRPFVIDNHHSNIHLLSRRCDVVWDGTQFLSRGYDIIWDGIVDNIGNAIYLQDDDRLKLLLKANVRGLTISQLPLATYHQYVVRLIKAGVMIEFDTTINYDDEQNVLTSVINIYQNVVKTQIGPLSIHIGENYFLQQFLKLTNIPYRLIGLNDDNKRGMYIRFDEVFDLDDQFKDGVMEYFCHNQYHGYIEALLTTDYIPPIELLVNSTPKIRTVIVILESSLTDGYKVSYLTRRLTEGGLPNDDYHFYYHPTCLKYLRMIDDYQSLPSSIRMFLSEGAIPLSPNSTTLRTAINNYDLDYINSNQTERLGYIISDEDYVIIHLTRLGRNRKRDHYEAMVKHDGRLAECINPGVSQYWSQVPVDNENFLKYLQWKGIQLPPNRRNINSITQLSRNPDRSIITKLVNTVDSNRSIIILIQLMSRGLIDIRDYLDTNSCIAKMLANYQPIR